MRLIVGMLAVTAALVLSAGRVLADSIDGDWCRDERSFRIQGSKIITWGGRETTGENSRHGFRYKAPEGDPEAGTDVDMVLRDENTVEIARPDRGSRSGEPELWRRCRVTS